MFTKVLRLSALVGGLLLAAASGSSKPQQQQQPYYPPQGQQQPYYPPQGQQQPYYPQQPQQGGGYENAQGGGGGAGFGGGNYGGGGGDEGYNSGWSQEGDIVKISFDMDSEDPLGTGFCGHASRAGCELTKNEPYACFANCQEGRIGLWQEGKRVTMGCQGMSQQGCQDLANRILNTP